MKLVDKIELRFGGGLEGYLEEKYSILKELGWMKEIGEGYYVEYEQLEVGRTTVLCSCLHKGVFAGGGLSVVERYAPFLYRALIQLNVEFLMYKGYLVVIEDGQELKYEDVEGEWLVSKVGYAKWLLGGGSINVMDDSGEWKSLGEYVYKGGGRKLGVLSGVSIRGMGDLESLGGYGLIIKGRGAELKIESEIEEIDGWEIWGYRVINYCGGRRAKVKGGKSLYEYLGLNEREWNLLERGGATVKIPDKVCIEVKEWGLRAGYLELSVDSDKRLEVRWQEVI